MYAHLTTCCSLPDASANELVRRRHSLDAEINDETKQSVPCYLQFGHLKQSKQCLRDENAEVADGLITVHRALAKRREN